MSAHDLLVALGDARERSKAREKSCAQQIVHIMKRDADVEATAKSAALEKTRRLVAERTVLEARVAKLAERTDAEVDALRFAHDGDRLVAHLAGWRLEVGRRPAPVLKAIAATPHGSRFTLPFAEPAAVEASPVDVVEGEVVAKVTVEHGVHTDDAFEYFLSGALAGALFVERRGDVWKAQLRRSMVPRVLRYGGPLLDGRSGLPASLEKVVPDALRFWESDEPATCRDALVRSGLFDAARLRIVDGEIRATTVKRYLYEKEDTRPTTVAARLASLIPRGRDYLHPFLTEDWRECVKSNADVADALLVLSPPTSDQCPHDMAAALCSVDGADWLVESDDSPESRAAFKVIGRPFKLAGDSRLFCASFPVEHSDVEWVDKVEVAKPFAGFPDFDACVAAQEEQGNPAAAARAICGALQRDTETRKAWHRPISIHKTEEERYVLGIVLEPNDGKRGAPLDPDAQTDIYSAADVREAAHTFMADFRNLGMMHKEFINGAAAILESYIAPDDFTIGGTKIRKGTWLLAIRCIEDGLWQKVKSGELTGFSIGGSAIRSPVTP